MEQQLMLAQAYLQANNVNNAMLVYQEMIKALSKSERNNAVYFWLALVKNNLAKLYFSIGEIQKAGNYSAQAVQALSSISFVRLLPDQVDEYYGSMAQCKANLALVYARLNNQTKYEKYYLDAMVSINMITHLSEEDQKLKDILEQPKASDVSMFRSSSNKKAPGAVTAVRAFFK